MKRKKEHRVRKFLKKEWNIYFHHPLHNKRLRHVLIGLGLTLSGSYCATHPLEHLPLLKTALPEFIWDGFSYSLHGFGAAPLIKTIGEFIKWEI